jgi:DNA-3-methyladenine glycosylase
MSSLKISLKRVYEAPDADDGVRILVERLWPRGLTKASVAADHWIKDIAPSAELRTWFGHRVERWEEFCERYHAELDNNDTALETLKRLCAGQSVTFLFAAKDIERNGAVALRDYLLAEPR